MYENYIWKQTAKAAVGLRWIDLKKINEKIKNKKLLQALLIFYSPPLAASGSQRAYLITSHHLGTLPSAPANKVDK